MSNRTAFITGLEGFTGNYLKHELETAGYQVFGTVRSCTTSNTVFSCDLLDSDILCQHLKAIRPDYIINLAGISFVKHGSAIDIYQANQIGTLSLLEAIAKSKHLPKKILLPSSAHIYGNQATSLLSETCTPIPNSDYGISKLAMEQLATLWFERLPIIIARPFNYTGLGQAPIFLPPKIVNHFIHKSSYIELGNLDVARDWSDVRDVVRYYRCLLESDQHSLIVNVCSGTIHSLQYVLDLLTNISGHELSVVTNPEFIRSNEIKELRGDNRLLASVIPSMKNRPLRETLAWMYQERC